MQEQNQKHGLVNNHVNNLQGLSDGHQLNSNNFQVHSKSQKPIEFKKIQNLSVKASGQAIAVPNIQSQNMNSQKNLVKVNYDELKKAMHKDSVSIGNV